MSAPKRSDLWMPFYFADYFRDTLHLTRDEHGGYLLLIAACWAGGGRIPNDPQRLASITKSSPKSWRKLAPILLPLFREDGEWLIHKRVLQEHEKAKKLSHAKRANGILGGRPKKAIGFLEDKLNETPARVTVPSPETQQPSPPQKPNQGEAIDYQDRATAGVVVQLRRGDAP